MSFLSFLLKLSFFRKRVLFHLKSHYFHEFGHSIPLGKGYWGHLLEDDAYDSFSEIFIQQEYHGFLPKSDFSRIIDLGANYGYFSLWLQTRFSDRKIRSLLIEPSQHCKRSLENLVHQPQLKDQFIYLQRAVADTANDLTDFYDRPFMAGSIFNSPKNEASNQVPVLKEIEIHDAIQPPYEMIKCDVEGSEWELLCNYSKTLSMSKHLLLEWHSWHSGGGGFTQLVDHLKLLEFEIIKSSKPTDAVGKKGQVGLILAKNLRLVA